MSSPVLPHVENHADAIRFIGFTANLWNEPIIIVDIRSNQGGSISLPVQWLNSLMGVNVPETGIMLISLCDKIYETLYHPGIFEYQNYRVFRPSHSFDGNHRISGYPHTGIIDNNPFIIMLVDRYTAGSGERMADMMFNMANTLVIGQNTRGSAISDSGWPIILPNTGIVVSFGNMLILFPEGHFATGRGITPDIWVTGDALTAALAMVENHISFEAVEVVRNTE